MSNKTPSSIAINNQLRALAGQITDWSAPFSMRDPVPSAGLTFLADFPDGPFGNIIANEIRARRAMSPTPLVGNGAGLVRPHFTVDDARELIAFHALDHALHNGIVPGTTTGGSFFRVKVVTHCLKVAFYVKALESVLRQIDTFYHVYGPETDSMQARSFLMDARFLTRPEYRTAALLGDTRPWIID